jgi:hypothetical protein
MTRDIEYFYLGWPYLCDPKKPKASRIGFEI